MSTPERAVERPGERTSTVFALNDIDASFVDQQRVDRCKVAVPRGVVQRRLVMSIAMLTDIHDDPTLS